MDQQTDILEVPSNVSELHSFHLVTPVDPNAFSDETTNWLWNKVRTQDYAFDDLSRDNPTAFCLALLAPQTAHFFVKDQGQSYVGWCLVKGLYKYSNPDIHFCLWDDNFNALQAKNAAKEIIDWTFKTWDVNRITAMVPEYNDKAKRLATLLRFQHEGRMKEAIMYYGKWRSVDMFGLLKRDFYHKVN